MKVIFFIFFLFNWVSCTSSHNNPISRNKENIKIEDKLLNKHYVFENDTLQQYLELSWLNEKTISFKLVSKNMKRKQESKIEGVAKLKNGDIEIDEDAEGNAFPVNEYIFEKNCWLAFRLDKNTQTKVSILEADCMVNNIFCPFASIDYLIQQ